MLAFLFNDKKKKKSKKTKRWLVKALSLFGTCRRSDFLGLFVRDQRRTDKMIGSEVEMTGMELYLEAGDLASYLEACGAKLQRAAFEGIAASARLRERGLPGDSRQIPSY